MTNLQFLGILYYCFAYATAIAMYLSGTLYIALGGCAIACFITYQLIQQFSEKE